MAGDTIGGRRLPRPDTACIVLDGGGGVIDGNRIQSDAREPQGRYRARTGRSRRSAHASRTTSSVHTAGMDGARAERPASASSTTSWRETPASTRRNDRPRRATTSSRERPLELRRLERHSGWRDDGERTSASMPSGNGFGGDVRTRAVQLRSNVVPIRASRRPAHARVTGPACVAKRPRIVPVHGPRCRRPRLLPLRALRARPVNPSLGLTGLTPGAGLSVRCRGLRRAWRGPHAARVDRAPDTEDGGGSARRRGPRAANRTRRGVDARLDLRAAERRSRLPRPSRTRPHHRRLLQEHGDAGNRDEGRRLPHRRRHRRGWDGRRLRGDPALSRPAGRAEGAARRTWRRRRVPRALPAGGHAPGRARPSEHRSGLRGGRERGRPLHRDAPHSRRRSEGPHRLRRARRQSVRSTCSRRPPRRSTPPTQPGSSTAT